MGDFHRFALRLLSCHNSALPAIDRRPLEFANRLANLEIPALPALCGLPGPVR
jgi:hypothetical protein